MIGSSAQKNKSIDRDEKRTNVFILLSIILQPESVSSGHHLLSSEWYEHEMQAERRACPSNVQDVRNYGELFIP
jgi:hypothetical protein